MKELEARYCAICNEPILTSDKRVKYCKKHQTRYNAGMRKKKNEVMTVTDLMLKEHLDNKREKTITLINFILNCIIAFGVTCNLILNIIK